MKQLASGGGLRDLTLYELLKNCLDQIKDDEAEIERLSKELNPQSRIERLHQLTNDICAALNPTAMKGM